MRINYIDASEMMADLLAELPPDPRISVHVGDPDEEALVALAHEAEVILNGHTSMGAALLARLPALALDRLERRVAQLFERGAQRLVLLQLHALFTRAARRRTGRLFHP